MGMKIPIDKKYVYNLQRLEYARMRITKNMDARTLVWAYK